MQMAVNTVVKNIRKMMMEDHQPRKQRRRARETDL